MLTQEPTAGRRIPSLVLAAALLVALCAGPAVADTGPAAITASIPLSHLDFSDVQSAIHSLPEELQDRLAPEEMIFSEAGRVLVVHDRPADISLLRELLRRIDIGRKQVRIDVSVREVAGIGEQSDSSSPGGALPEGYSVADLIGRAGRTVATGRVRVIDRESASMTVGQIRTLRTRSLQASDEEEDEEEASQDAFTTEEVPVGITLSLTPEIHNDGTLTLELDVADERVLAVGDFGVDRSTRNSQTQLRLRDGETVAVGGFVSCAARHAGPSRSGGRESASVRSFYRDDPGADPSRARIILLTAHILDYDKATPETRGP